MMSHSTVAMPRTVGAERAVFGTSVNPQSYCRFHVIQIPYLDLRREECIPQSRRIHPDTLKLMCADTVVDAFPV
jgi:hypothetical protein